MKRYLDNFVWDLSWSLNCNPAMSAMDAEEDVAIGTVEEEARKRKERIRALQQLKEARESDSSGLADDNKPLPV